MIVFKAVVIRNGKYQSFVNDPKWTLDYDIGTEVRPRIGKLFVWTELIDAKNMILYRDNVAILRCETEQCEPLLLVPSPYVTDYWTEFWRSSRYGTYLSARGTYVCNSVHVLGVVYAKTSA